jgi:hypothetical protein
VSSSALPDPILAVASSSWIPASSEDREAVLQQLDRMLAHSSFRNSKRYSSLFRYLVERTLRGDRNLKERVLGTEVFGRDPDYDTNEDPVVRVTAGEIRRRIAQYYYEPGHEDEIRIDLPPGSYSPLFRLAATAPAGVKSISEGIGFARVPELVEDASQDPQAIKPTGSVARPQGKLSAFQIAAVAAVVCVVAFAAIWSKVGVQTTIDKFWAPVLASKSTVLICIPDLDSGFSGSATNAAAASGTNVAPATPYAQAMTALGHDFRRERVSFSDSVALASLTGLLGGKNVDFRIKRSEDASLDDLKGGPVVLVAGANNQWTMKLGKQLRFTFERDGDRRYVSDAQDPSSRQWEVTGPDFATNQVVDYGIISRTFDATTGQFLVTAAGLHHNGTEAAGVCLASEACLRQAGKMASGDWSKNSLQFVIETPVLGDEPGQPRVVAATLW